MAPNSRNDPDLQRRISSLHLSFGHDASDPTGQRRLPEMLELLSTKLHPLYPQPTGPPHPKFPKTILHWLLLTEDELDSIAHYYSQSTPDVFTNTYPAPMGWDKEFLARPEQNSPQLMPWDEEWLDQFRAKRRHSGASSSTQTWPTKSYTDSASCTSSPPNSQPPSRPSSSASRCSDHRRHRHQPILRSASEPVSQPVTPPPLTTTERVMVKRRKLGKFMGLRGCETPIPEVERRIAILEARLDRAMRLEMARRDADDGWGGSRGPPKFGKGML
jgi:hypothetical protein